MHFIRTPVPLPAFLEISILGMGYRASELPDNILRLMPRQDRRKLGVQSADEAAAKCEARAEKQLQREIATFLAFQRNEGRCQYINPPMHIRSTLPEGWPDFSIFLSTGRCLLIECKTLTGAIRPSQNAMHVSLNNLGHPVHIVRSIRDFLALWESEKARP